MSSCLLVQENSSGVLTPLYHSRHFSWYRVGESGFHPASTKSFETFGSQGRKIHIAALTLHISNIDSAYSTTFKCSSGSISYYLYEYLRLCSSLFLHLSLKISSFFKCLWLRDLHLGDLWVAVVCCFCCFFVVGGGFFPPMKI